MEHFHNKEVKFFYEGRRFTIAEVFSYVWCVQIQGMRSSKCRILLLHKTTGSIGTFSAIKEFTQGKRFKTTKNRYQLMSKFKAIDLLQWINSLIYAGPVSNTTTVPYVFVGSCCVNDVHRKIYVSERIRIVLITKHLFEKPSAAFRRVHRGKRWSASKISR